MFGRKRKDKEPDNLGLSAPVVSPVTSPTSATSVTSASSATPGAGGPTAPTPMPATMTSAAAIPTSPTAMLGQILGGRGALGDLLSEIKADPQAFRARIVAQTQAAGVSTFVLTPQGLTQLGGAPATQQHVDVIDELTKAADLHDKGVLTDAEFDTLKKKLLGE